MLPLYTSILSTEQYGTVDLISTYTSLLMIVLTIQFEQGIFRHLIEVRSDSTKQKQYISTAMLSVSVFIILFIATFSGLLMALDYQYTFYLIAISSLSTWNALLLQTPRGLGDNTTYAIGSFINGSLTVILNVIFVAILRLEVKGMLLANVVSLFVSSAFIVCRIRLWNYLGWKYANKQCFYELLKYSLPLVPYTLCWWVISASDRMLIKMFLGTSFNGIYAAAYKFPSLFSMVTNIFQLSWTESASENVNETDRDQYYSKVFTKTFKLYSSVNMGLILVMPFFFDMLIGEAFSEAYYYIPILLSAALFHSIAAMYGSIYFAFKKTKAISTTTLLAALINLVVNFLLIRSIGLYAAAISSLVAYIVITLIRHTDIQRLAVLKISKTYLLIEAVVYIPVLISYYKKNLVLSGLMLVLGGVYCIWQNREIMISTLNLIYKKIRNR